MMSPAKSANNSRYISADLPDAIRIGTHDSAVCLFVGSKGDGDDYAPWRGA